jgi:hypothetical protein
MIQEYRAVVVDSRRHVTEMCGRQFGLRQGFKIRDIEDLVGSDRCGLGCGFRHRRTETDARDAE